MLTLIERKCKYLCYCQTTTLEQSKLSGIKKGIYYTMIKGSILQEDMYVSKNRRVKLHEAKSDRTARRKPTTTVRDVSGMGSSG